MKRRIVLALIATALVSGAGLLIAHNASAQGIPIDPGPCRPGWTCDCNTTEVERFACVTGNGTPGHLFVTVCQQCPPPDCERPEGPCRIFPCENTVTTSCR